MTPEASGALSAEPAVQASIAPKPARHGDGRQIGELLVDVCAFGKRSIEFRRSTRPTAGEVEIAMVNTSKGAEYRAWVTVRRAGLRGLRAAIDEVLERLARECPVEPSYSPPAPRAPKPGAAAPTSSQDGRSHGWGPEQGTKAAPRYERDVDAGTHQPGTPRGKVAP